MWHDPIVQETRGLRDAFAAQYGHDADAIFQAILEKQALSQRSRVSYVQPPSEPVYDAQAAAPEQHGIGNRLCNQRAKEPLQTAAPCAARSLR